jgi:anti-sigma28 factor (negative regulator of flagellin synthesis)
MDFDENSLDSATADQHQFLKTAQSQSKEVETLKSQLTNGSFGMEDEDYDYSNQASYF